MARAGAVWIDVLPSLVHFNELVRNQATVALDGVGAAAGKGYGLSLAKGAKDGMSGLTTMVEGQFKAAADKAAAAVEASATKVEAASKRQADALGAVRVAQERLTLAQQAAGGAATEKQALAITVAEENLAKASRTAETAAGSLARAEGALAAAHDRAAIAAERVGTATEEASVKGSAKFAGFASSVEAGTGRIVGKFAEFGKSALMLGGIFGAFEVAKFAGDSIKASLDFQKSSQVLVNAAGESQSKLAEIKQGMLNISSETGTDLAQVSEGMYTVEKAGIRGAAGLKVMSDAAKLARDENADLGVVTNALTTVMATSNGKITDSAKASNALMVAAGNSKTSLQEFAGSLSSVLPVSSKIGIGFDQVAGAIGAMTAQGMSASQATQNLNHVIQALAVPNRVAATEMQAFGISAQDVRDNLGKRGLQGTIEMLSDTVKSKLGPSAAQAAAVIQGMPAKYQDMWAALEKGTTTLSGFEKKVGSAKDLTAAQKEEILKAVPASQGYFQAISKMTGGLTGLNVATMLTGSNAAKFSESTKSVAEAMGNAKEFGDKWNATQATAQVRLDQAKDTAKAVGISIATNLLPYIANAAAGFADLIKGVVAFTGAHWDTIKEVAGYVGIFAGTLGTVVLGIKAWTLASEGLAAVQAILNGEMAINPIGLIVVGIAALVTGLIYAYNHFQTFHDIVNAAWAGIKTAVSATVEWITKTAWPALQTAWHAIGDAAVTVWHALVSAWSGIRTAVSAVVDWFTKTAWPALQTAWKAVGDAAMWLWHTIFEPVWTAIKVIVAIVITAVVLEIKLLVAIWQDVLAPALTWLWHTIFEPAWNGIMSAVKAVSDWFSGTFVPGLKAEFQAVASAALWLWHNVFEPAWNGIKTAIKTVIDWLAGVAYQAIQTVWKDLSNSALWLWHEIFEPVWNGIKLVVNSAVLFFQNTVVPIFNTVKNDIANAFLWLWHGVAEPVWNGIRSAASAVSDWFSTTVVGTFNTVRDKISSAFGSLKDAITSAWNAIRDTAKAPIEFVVNTVFAGLVRTYNDVANVVHAPPITVPHVQFASGGIMPGYTPGQDVYDFVDRKSGMRLGLSGGEPILRPEAGAVLGHGWVNGINAAARSGGQAGVRGFLGFADGGTFPGGSFAAAGGAFDWLKSAASSAASAVSGAASNVASFVSDPMSAFKALGERLVGGIPGNAALHGLMTGIAGKVWDGLAGMVSKFATVGSSANQQGGPLHGSVPGSASAAAAVSWAQSMLGSSGWLDKCLAFVNAAWGHKVSWLGMPRAIDAWNAAPGKHPGDSSPPAGAALFYDHLGPAGHVDLSLGGNSLISTDLPTRDKVGLVGFNTPMSQWGAHYLGWAMPRGYADGGVFQPVKPLVRDSGGPLPTGYSMVYNGTGSTEHVLTSRQYAELQQPHGRSLSVAFNGPVGANADEVVAKMHAKERDMMAIHNLDLVAVN